MAATLLITGAFHEDGLADVCDGLGGTRDRERALAIMTDSRIGAFGAIGIGVIGTAGVWARSDGVAAVRGTLTLLRHARPCGPAGICYGRTDFASDPGHEQALLDGLLSALSPQRVVSSPASRCCGLAMRLSRCWRRHCEIEPRLQIETIYQVIAARRDMRHFRSDPLDEALMARLLQAAHCAPSVGYAAVALHPRAIRRAAFADASARRGGAARNRQGARRTDLSTLVFEDRWGGSPPHNPESRCPMCQSPAPPR